MDKRVIEERYEDDKYGQGIWEHVKIMDAVSGWKFCGMGRAATKEEALESAISDAQDLLSKHPDPEKLPNG